MDSVLSQRLPAAIPNETRGPALFFGGAMAVLIELIGFSIPVSTSLSEIATTLFILCWFASGDWRARTRVIAANPVALLSLAMFGVLLLATTWSSVTWLQSFRCLLKYREFLYLPLLVPIVRDPRLKVAGMRGFTVGAVGMLLLSYVEWLTGVDVGLASSPNDYVIAKDRIIHSILMALLVYFSAQEIARGSRFRWLHGAVIALAAPNILFLVQGRTGYLLLGLLTVLFLTQWFGRKGLVCACLLVGATAWGAYAGSETVRARVAQTITQIKNQFGYPKQHSWDPRLEYYEHTLRLIGRHPLRGTGTGSFEHEYAELASTAGVERTSDPHNEYMHLAVQAGLPGGAMFVLLLAAQWYCAGRLPTWDARVGRGVVLAIAVGSLFNSLILSVTGGLIWSFFSALAFATLTQSQSSQPGLKDNPAPPQAAGNAIITSKAA
jgi:O-antigen ligase